MIRDATREDFVAFYGVSPPVTMRAIALARGGELVGIGGYYIDNGVAVVFTDSRSDMTKREALIAGNRIHKMLKDLKVDVIAKAGPAGDTALRHYGFSPWGDYFRMDRR